MEVSRLVTSCGCQFKVVSALPVLDGGFLQLTSPCVPHSQARTVHLKEKESELLTSLKSKAELIIDLTAGNPSYVAFLEIAREMIAEIDATQ